MKLRTLCATALVSAALVGCHQRHAAAPEPLSPEALQSVRESYTRVDPKAMVGAVIASLPEKGLVAVGGLPVKEFQEGDILVFVDASKQVIAAGKVIAKTADALHVSYDLRGANSREPQVGDLAVRSGQ